MVLDHLDNSCFLLSSMLQSYSEPTLYLFVFSGTRPSANSESSSSLANFEAFGRSLNTGGGAVRVVYSVRDRQDSWAWQIKKRTTRTVGPLPHSETVCSRSKNTFLVYVAMLISVSKAM